MRLEGVRRILTGLALRGLPRSERGGAIDSGDRTFRRSTRAAVPRPGTSNACADVGAMAAYEGLIVQKIDFADLPAAGTVGLSDLIPQQVGAPLEREKVRQSIQALHATGRFADIQAEAERSPDGQVELTFRMRANFFVGQIFVEGAPNPPAANQIVNATKLQLGELFTREKLERGLDGIKQLMEQNGYYQSSVTDEEAAPRRRPSR